MPRNKGTSRKGKPGKSDRQAGMGRALQRATQKRYKPKSNGSSRGGGMAASGAQSLGFDADAAANKKMLSVLEVDDLSDFLTQAEMASREFVSEREQFVVLDDTGAEYKHEPQYKPNIEFDDAKGEAKSNQPQSDKFLFKELSVPRRPQWSTETTAQELDKLEKESFLEWRRAIALREEKILSYCQTHGMAGKTNTTVTPFEKNLEVWKQLWRVLERSQCVIQIVDGRNPLFYLSSDLRTYAETELGKPMLILVNKCDFLTEKQRKIWHDYFNANGIEHIFFSAFSEQKKLDEAAQEERRKLRDEEDPRFEAEDNDDSDDENIDNENDKIKDLKKAADSIVENPEEQKLMQIGVKTPLTRDQLLEALNRFADKKGISPIERYSNRVQFGMVGFPNVGKSSVINVLVGSSKHTHNLVRVGVASQPGKTKHFQTLLLPDRDDMMLCDCPGLVFPSFVSSSGDLIAAGVFPIAQMRDHWPVVELICRRIPREILNAQYGITLPKPTMQDLKERGLTDSVSHDDDILRNGSVSANLVRLPPPTAEELLETFCIARSILSSHSGVPDYQRASRVFIKDYVEGKLVYCHPPPTSPDCNLGINEVDFHKETLLTAILKIKKIREKLGITITEGEKVEDGINGQGSESDPVNNELIEFDELGLDDGLDIFDAVEGFAQDGEEVEVNGGKRGKKHKSIQNWGKKGRKLRNKDPYGCHSQPDTEFKDSAGAAMGVYAHGQHGGGAGYTRPSYGATNEPVEGKKSRRRNKQ
mmetsp:Transcript_4767/g.4496  ORF Transcript_4767/g.4496 Transcript_4767/m.4496 type:complete len:760 (-) Transcript_4767:78-2357(-)|eukprot:CAMPEP_0197828580 /NCGR_PEP_ID=MMETSP1437-20131217/5111_1 /TAXON_ID=49252 ORGANISM="Eucampia antarctica, Strain CCMP1452" /NCGR_SAMPLE_ID=MMETSP1437 /ASSEMBLY_ACC=CAM_ASM_001096 /LENGTH=759 /DNA_ID=CAMNT_0043429835 /DNA_START=116 /DNA_END=2395 /DNA_ORIENTATION=+